MIDRKYKILAVNPCSGKIHTEDDSILFCAKDQAVVKMLREYYLECERIGCDDSHLESIGLLTKRVVDFQRAEGSKIPDTDTPCEIDRCIGGKV